MKVAFVTNLRAPYRILQFNEFSKIDKIEFTAYYTHKESENRKWESKKSIGYKEVYLDGVNILKEYGYVNKGLYNLVKNNDIIIIGGYEQPTYILISILCRILKKPYVISYDGISTDRLEDKENSFKKIIKNMVVKNANYILGNGTVSKRYFNEVFNYPEKRIYNQYLTVDSKKINELYKNREKYRTQYRKKYNIDDNHKVLVYSGRLVEVKNLESVIKAIGELKRSDITFLILGSGELEESLRELAQSLNINMVITGFIVEQEELFKHYFAGDCFILPSTYEPWGLVINEAMCAGLPVIVSSICGCSLDLVKDKKNGYIVDSYDIYDISSKIKLVLYYENIDIMGRYSRKIIEEWSYVNSRKELEKIIDIEDKVNGQ